jgi:hypothetical protein
VGRYGSGIDKVEEACAGKREANSCCHTPCALTLIGGLNK